jgi:hypothetical protein
MEKGTGDTGMLTIPYHEKWISGHSRDDAAKFG